MNDTQDFQTTVLKDVLPWLLKMKAKEESHLTELKRQKELYSKPYPKNFLLRIFFSFNTKPILETIERCLKTSHRELNKINEKIKHYEDYIINQK